jgi:hypothetical protein
VMQPMCWPLVFQQGVDDVAETDIVIIGPASPGMRLDG